MYVAASDTVDYVIIYVRISDTKQMSQYTKLYLYIKFYVIAFRRVLKSYLVVSKIY
jgi:hypothetical protein